MEITRPPTLDGTRGADPAPSAQNLTLRQGAVAAPEADRADIRPLSISTALQILITEVLDQWSLPPPPSPSQPPSPTDSPGDAAMSLVQTFMQSLPASDMDANRFLAAYDTLLVGLERGIEQALGVVGAWRGAPREALDALGETRSMVFSVLGDEAPNPSLAPWLMRAEWLEFAPRIELLRRRRRWARRVLLDPDLPLPSIDGERNA
jgi:hypothetical protein